MPEDTEDYCCSRAFPGVKGSKKKSAHRDRIWDWSVALEKRQKMAITCSTRNRRMNQDI